MDDLSTYRLSLAHVLRLVAPAVIGAGLAWLVVALTGVTGVVRGTLAVVTLLVVVASVVMLLRPPRVLVLDADGYLVSLVRGVGVKQATWPEVEAVTSRSVGGSLAMVVELDQGRTSIVPLTLLGPRHVAAQREVHERLNAAHGYRRLSS